MAKKRVKRQKATHLSVAVKDEQMSRWQQAADREGRSLSEWVRHVLDVQSIVSLPEEMKQELTIDLRKDSDELLAAMLPVIMRRAFRKAA